MKLLRANDVIKILGISLVTLWRMRRAGQFPEPVSISVRAVGWKEATIHEWVESRKVVGV